MALKYTELDQVKSEYISINGLTESFHKLLENDDSLLTSLRNKPGVWEKKWYNDDGILGYQKGAAVWLNTEDVTQFINARFDEIEHYILNSDRRGEYLSISSDPSKTFEMFKNVCNGENGYRRLYYLGELTADAQVRVSLSSNNKNPPNDDTCWVDAFRLSSVESYQRVIRKELEKDLEQNLSTHIENYHLTSMSVAELTSKYLLNDFSNISLKQQVQTHNVRNRGDKTEGFDCVRIFAESNNGGNYRWFRLWNSGYLEHGGRLTCEDSVISVNFDWEYDVQEKDDNGAVIIDPSTGQPKVTRMKSVVYDYPVQVDGMYAMDKELWVQGQKQNINPLNVGSQMTYSVYVTPIATSIGQLKNINVEIFNVGNGGFQFSNENGKVSSFSYNAFGFVTITSLMKWGVV